MIFLTLALISATATCFHLYLYSKNKNEELELEVERRLAAEDKIKADFVEKENLKEVNEEQKLCIKKISSKNREAFANIDVLNEKIEAQEIAYAKLMKDNETLRGAVEKLSQKELIGECRAFYNALEQRKKDMLAALNSLESSFNLVKRVYSAQTTIDDCVTTIKSVPVQPPTITASGKIDKWPYESRFWNGDSE